MKNALFAMALMLVGAAGCGGSESSPMDKACDKLESCQTLSTVFPSAPTAAQCKQAVSSKTSGLTSDVRNAVDQMVTECLKKDDCAAVSSCFSALLLMMPKE